jgi:hypothetical protein
MDFNNTIINFRKSTEREYRTSRSMKPRRGVCGRIPCAHRDKAVKRAVEWCGDPRRGSSRGAEAAARRGASKIIDITKMEAYAPVSKRNYPMPKIV